MDQDQRSESADSLTSAPVGVAQLAAQLWLVAAQLEETRVLMEHLQACLRAVRVTTPGGTPTGSPRLHPPSSFALPHWWR